MAMAGRHRRRKTESRSRQRTCRTGPAVTRQRCCVEQTGGTETKPRGLEETERRKKTESRRIQKTEEREDMQKPATFWEEHGHFRCGVFTGAGEKG
ncbi:hypothetical protein NDU88_001878 [Pleurodeles waltl]|uniref:Uncharacterized protein n=1 Tax=Pleurodeles waltl TaxID=8319 RepID=A0AAV7LZA6_PLEWA|nr:hypothetical protein NDU88_001878 [Pleurodeles waltl]